MYIQDSKSKACIKLKTDGKLEGKDCHHSYTTICESLADKTLSHVTPAVNFDGAKTACPAGTKLATVTTKEDHKAVMDYVGNGRSICIIGALNCLITRCLNQKLALVLTSYMASSIDPTVVSTRAQYFVIVKTYIEFDFIPSSFNRPGILGGPPQPKHCRLQKANQL